MIDLHTHTSASDGVYSPKELIEQASLIPLKAISITDHDTVDGLAEGEKACQKLGILFLPGIEIEIDWEEGEFHLLGIGIWNWRGEFQKKLSGLQENREERNLTIVSRMQADGIPVNYEEIKDLAGGDIIGRPHIARFLVQKGLAQSIEEAFHRFITPGKPYYVRKKAPSLREGVELIHSAGGKAIIAHPNTLKLPNPEEALPLFKEQGVDGIEAYHPRIPLKEASLWVSLANKYNLLITAGSDFHGPSVPDRELGKASEGSPIEDTFLSPFLIRVVV